MESCWSSTVQQFPVQREQPRFLDAWPEWKCGSVRGLNTFPHRIVGKKLFPEPGEETGPAAFHTQSRGWRALEALLLPPFPFQKTETNSQNNTPVKKVQCMLRNTGGGSVLGVRKALPVLTTIGRKEPSGRSHHEVNRLGFSRTPVAFPVSLYNELDFWIRHFDCIWIDDRETAIPCPIPVIKSPPCLM